ncbi:hypothetical protein HWV62_28716 [Athelia sp. TMB]|nr:hypothetical protein HWV62_28716 [Athelia sp. TMB]
MQARIRTPLLDRYFVYTSSLGTHTFFMTFLPMCFFFGFDQFGRGISIALFIYTHIHRLASAAPGVPPSSMITTLNPPSDWAISTTTYWISTALLVFYAFSIVFGRLYTAMHTFTDCAAGVIMGALVWAGHWALEDVLETWLVTSGWSAPAMVMSLCVVMVNQHPVPIDDCPCFEDAIAFISVLMGMLVGRWQAVHMGFDAAFFASSMPGTFASPVAESAFASTLTATGVWWAVMLIKMVFGVLVIFAWRIVAKSTLHLVLPPTFRLLMKIFTLPHRRFYTPASDYKSVPSDLGLRPIPSVIDLPGMLGMEMEVDGGRASGLASPLGGGDEVRARSKIGNGNGEKFRKLGHGTIYGANAGNEKRGWELEKNGDAQVKDEPVKHYDADVITKVIVYSGIAFLATTWLPILFEVVGLGVKSW